MSDYRTYTSSAFTPPQQASTSRSARLPWINLILLVLTMISTMAVGTFLSYSGLFGRELPSLISGFLFATTLLLILGAHELGHYFVARWHGVDASLPYFIPAPLGLGTFGAFIRMRAPVPNRRALFDVGLAGPLLGLAVALPLFIAGLFLAPLRYGPSVYGESLLVSGLSMLTEWLRGAPQNQHLILHPVGFAAYVGLFITAINLLPVGQLDGGHVAYALFTRNSFILSLISVVFLVVLGWVTGWYSWYFWAFLIMIFGLRHPHTLNDQIPIRGTRWLLALLGFLLLALLFSPNPFPWFR